MNRLKKVTVEPEDVTAITAGMSKRSNYTGHDGAQEEPTLRRPRPKRCKTVGAWLASLG